MQSLRNRGPYLRILLYEHTMVWIFISVGFWIPVGYTASGVRKSASFVFGSQALSESHRSTRIIESISTAFWIPNIQYEVRSRTFLPNATKKNTYA
jgi:hypothetical protein